MKKALLLIVVIVVLFSGCNPSYAMPIGDTRNGQTAEQTARHVTQKPQTVAPSAKATKKIEVTPTPGNVVMGKSVFYAWEDMLGNIWVYAACELINDGGTPVQVSNIDFYILGEGDEVLGAIQYNSAAPDILGPGEMGFSCGETIIDTIDNPDLVKNFEIYGAVVDTQEKRNMLTVSDAKYYPPKNYSSHKVTGWVVNDSGARAANVALAIAMYDANGELLGILTSDPSYVIEKDAKAPFEAAYPSINNGAPLDVATIVGKAYDWTMD